MKVTIHGPNGFWKDGITFHVHRAGCADLGKRHYRSLGSGNPPLTFDTADLKEIVETLYGDIIDENEGEATWYEENGDADNAKAARVYASWEAYTNEFKVFPCVTDLPDEAEGGA